MKTFEQPAFPTPEHVGSQSEEPSEKEQYRQRVASQFTAPLIEEAQLLENLRQNWPGDAQETILALIAAHHIEVTPTGRYRLPLPAWSPPIPTQDESTTRTRPLSPVEPPVQPAPAVCIPARPGTLSDVPAAPAISTAPKFKPLRLAVPGRAA